MSTQRNVVREIALMLSAAGATLLAQVGIKALIRRTAHSPEAPPANPPLHLIEPPAPAATPPPIETRSASRLSSWWQTHWREVAIVLGLIAFGLFMWWSSPPADVDRPDPASLPFDLLLPARQFMLEQVPNAGPIIFIGGAATLAGLWLVALLKKHIRAALSASLLISAVLIALYGQVLLMTEFVEPGTLLYLIAAGLMLIWTLWQRPFRARSAAESDRAEAARSEISPRLELVLITIVMVITVFARTYEIKRVPYGIDGDEANWTIDLIGSKIDEQDTSSSLYHYRNLPMSFWMQTPFHWVLGPGLMPGRIEVIVFSILASFIFYLLVRELFDVPTALVATLLLAVALPDLSASRTGNIQAHFKIWAILPMFGAAVALRTRRPWHFFLTGLALAGGMLTYESLLPVVAAVGSFVGLTVLIDLIRHRTQWKAWLPRLGAFAVAPLPVGSFAMLYLVGRGQYYEDFRRAGEGLGLGELLSRGFGGVFASFYQSPLHDALYARGGPYINGLLVPLLALGIVLAVGTLWSKRGSALMLMWLVWVYFSVPVFLPGPLPRLYYSGLPALYIFIALLLLALYRAIANVIRKPAVTLPVALVLLGSFTVLELTIWFQEPQTTEDANMRRELAELVSRNVYPTDLLLLPIDPLGGEPLKVEQRVMQLFIRERYRVMDYGEFRQVALDKLLPTIALEGQRYRTIRVLHDMMQNPVVAHRQEIIEALRRCYPTSLKQRTSHFELYEINTTELTFATCRSTVLTIGPLPASVPANQPVTLNWSLDSIPASNADLTCWRSRPDVIWFEAEQMTQLAGWKAENTLSLSAPWTGNGYLVDDFPERVEAAHDIPLAVGGRYTIWVRTYRRQPDNFPAFLDVKGQTYTLADSSLGLDEWKWQKLDTIELAPGTLPVKLWRAFDRTQAVYFSLLIDSIVLTTDPEFDPAQSERWLPARQRGESFPNKAMHGAFELTIEPGQYRCQIVTRDADRLVDVTGQLGLTRMLEFEATPQ